MEMKGSRLTHQANSAADADTPVSEFAATEETICRMSLKAREEDPELFQFLDERRGQAANARVFSLMANCPEILKSFIAMADTIRAGHGLDPKLRELAIIVTCQTIGNNYEHDRHWNIARRLKMPREKLDNIWDFEKSEVFDDLERAVMRLARAACVAPTQVTDEVFNSAYFHLGVEQTLSLLFSIGWYNMTARITGVTNLRLEPDVKRL